MNIIKTKFKFSKKLVVLMGIVVLSFLAIGLLFSSCIKVDRNQTNKTIVFQSDFGLKDGAVSAMKGVALGVDPSLNLNDLTHEIPAYSIWDASYRLLQTIDYWPEKTVFVSVVDPGVGSTRNPIAVKTKNNRYIITPDNGTLTHIKDRITDARIIDKSNYRPGKSNNSYTFDGRDLFCYTAARLASGQINFEDIGEELKTDIVSLNYQKPEFKDNKLIGNIDIHDVEYGNPWTNIDENTAKQKNLEKGQFYQVTIKHNGEVKYDSKVKFCNTFSDVNEGDDVMLYNSMSCLCLATNVGNFVEKHNIGYGPEWTIEIQ